MASFLRYGKSTLVASVLTATAVTKTVLADEDNYFSEQSANQKGQHGSYDPNAMNTTQTPLGMPNMYGSTKDRYRASSCADPISGIRIKYKHQAPTNQTEITYDLLDPENPKYGKLEAEIKTEAIEATRDTNGSTHVQFIIPYTPVMVYNKEDDKGSHITVLRTQFPPTSSSMFSAKYQSDSQNSVVACEFSQSITNSTNIGTDVNIFVNEGQAVYTLNLNHYRPTGEGFVQSTGVEVTSNGSLNLHYLKPIYNGLLVGADYALDLNSANSQYGAFARIRTDKSRTLVAYQSNGTWTLDTKYVYNDHIKLLGSGQLGGKNGLVVGCGIEFERNLFGT